MSFWKKLIGENAEPDAPKPPPPSGYPQTYPPLGWNSPSRPEVFEPALTHYGRAFRLGDPQFASDGARKVWDAARLHVAHHLLGLVVASPWNEHLVLRGSLLLKAWLKEEAREPGDIDWVFRPKQIEKSHPDAKKFFRDLITAVRNDPGGENARIVPDKIAMDDIWTYERASGRRIVFPWLVDGQPGGEIQMDVVFCEDLYEAPIQTPIAGPDGTSLSVWAAAPEVSLAWKLQWLMTDQHPQGKDLYDAVLLAERTRLSRSLLCRMLRDTDWRIEENLQPDFSSRLNIDWENFQKEYPWIDGTEQEWKDRLTAALAPTFAKQ